MPTEGNKFTVYFRTFAELLDALDTELRERKGDWQELNNGPGATKRREERKKLRESKKHKK